MKKEQKEEKNRGRQEVKEVDELMRKTKRKRGTESPVFVSPH